MKIGRVACATTIAALALGSGTASAQLRCGGVGQARCPTPGPVVNAFTGANLGYSRGAIGDLGFAPDREWWGINAGINIRLLSFLTADRESGFVLWDLLYLDVDGLGKMTSDTLPYWGNPNLSGYEDRNQWSWGFGYELLGGLTQGRIAILGGLRWESFDHEVGAMMMDGSAFPFAARLVYGSDLGPIILEGSYGGGDYDIRSARVSIPFVGATHLSASYDRAEGIAISQLRAADLTDPNPEGGEVPARWTRLSFALRVISGAMVGF